MQVSAKRTGNWLKIGKGIAVIGMVSWVSACAPLLDQDFWDEATSFADDNYTALGLQQLASGDYASAEKYFDEALRKNPQDGHAMLWRSVLYQNTKYYLNYFELVTSKIESYTNGHKLPVDIGCHEPGQLFLT